MIKKAFILLTFILINKVVYSQTYKVHNFTIQDILEAQVLSSENPDKALILIKNIRLALEKIKLKNFTDPQIINNYCNAISTEIDIYIEKKEFDKALNLIKPFREEIKNMGLLNKQDLFLTYSTLTIQECDIYEDRKEFDKALAIVTPYRQGLFDNYKLNNLDVFSNYIMAVTTEGVIYMERDGMAKMSEYENEEADRLKPLIKGNNYLLDFYFRTKKSSILHSVTGVTDKSHYSKAFLRTQDLLKELETLSFSDIDTKNEIRESLTDNYFWYKYYLINPYVGGETLTKKSLDEAKLKYEELLKELEINNFISDEDKSDRIESINEKLLDLTESIKQKELNEGKYQTFIEYSENKNPIDSYGKGFNYFMEKINAGNSLIQMEMYYQQISDLKEILVELDSTNLKKNDNKVYTKLLYYINNSFYNTYFMLKNYEKALIHLEQSANYYKKLPKEKQLGVIINGFDTGFAAIYLVKGEFDKALEYASKPLESKEDFSGYEYSLLAQIYSKMKNYEKAIKWYKGYITFLKTELNSNFFNFVAYQGLGKAYLAIDYLDDAEESFNKSLFYLKSVEDSFNPDYSLSTVYSQLGVLYSKKQLSLSADENMIKFSESYRLPYFESLLSSTENSRTITDSQNFNGSNSLFYFLSQRTTNSGKVVSSGYDYAILSKQLLMNTYETIRNNASINEIPELKVINDKWTRIKERLKKVDVKNRDSLMDYARVYEKELITRGKESILELFKNSKIQWTDVKNQLKEGEAAIEFVSFTPYEFEKNNKGVVHYAAFVLKKDAEFPVFINLFKEDELNKTLNPIISKKLSITNRVLGIYKARGLEIFNLVWQPIEKHLTGTNKVYFSPSGVLHNLSFHALPTGNLSESLGEKYKLIQLSSTKNIVNPKTVYNFNKAALFGDIVYNYSSDRKESIVNENQKRNNRGSDFNELPGTKKEIEEIEKILLANNIEPLKYTQTSASEENLIKVAESNPSILHIGTHAFYLKPNNDEFFMTDMIGSARLIGDKNPMNRSGLALAEANYFWKYGDKIAIDKEDGVLTANEISTLNLKDVDLVVLSACETALGESTNNEGVFGLQRGLKMAGVKNLLLSLWKVDDNVTQEYMVTFYNNLIEKKFSIEDAYFETQKAIKAKYPNPYYWAAFIMIR